jgi:hypothetical protein
MSSIPEKIAVISWLVGMKPDVNKIIKFWTNIYEGNNV